ncbi:ABC transporter ATP-binding protein (plasmid) [Halorarum halophilum]|uniref:ABC-type D-xylose/L-arabinose transporter n=1 Tax=Halorarum halophilum TaxID=2743090 RepID=A0A7D5GEL6_9EURY|nr:ABC transporter ATP-binding protein [Halobaculum halophilum]QLG29905.1 ABC transporter ATP-binding protein [Halobaculum halophilum]
MASTSSSPSAEDSVGGSWTVTIDNLRKEFKVIGGVEVAVDDINFEIGENEFVSLVGPSGCGKTTTLRCVAGLETPTSGRILFGNRDVSDVPANKRNLAMMFQNIALYPHMTIKDNIAYPLKVRGVVKAERYDEAKKAAEIMQIPDMLEKYPGELSGGQRQRAALARTIVQDPSAFLMDEPLSDLDAKLKVEVRKEIQRVHKRVKNPTLYVTHDQEEAMTMSDRIAVMNDGRIEQIGTPEEMYSKPKNMFVAQFIGNPSMNFLDAEYDSSTHTVDMAAGDERVRLSVNLDREPGSDDVVVGVRPEAVSLLPDGQGDFSGRLQLVERIGDRILSTVDGPTHDGEIRATVSADHDLEEGEIVGMELNRDRLYFFDAGTGDAVGYEAIE